MDTAKKRKVMFGMKYDQVFDFHPETSNEALNEHINKDWLKDTEIVMEHIAPHIYVDVVDEDDLLDVLIKEVHEQQHQIYHRAGEILEKLDSLADRISKYRNPLAPDNKNVECIYGTLKRRAYEQVGGIVEVMNTINYLIIELKKIENN